MDEWRVWSVDSGEDDKRRTRVTRYEAESLSTRLFSLYSPYISPHIRTITTEVKRR